jgi:hypothetical protein
MHGDGGAMDAHGRGRLFSTCTGGSGARALQVDALHHMAGTISSRVCGCVRAWGSWGRGRGGRERNGGRPSSITSVLNGDGR